MSYVYAGTVMLAIYGLLFIAGRVGGSFRASLIITLTAFVFTAGGLYFMHSYDNNSALLLWLSLFLLAAMCALMRVTDNLSDRNFIMLMIAAGVMLRLTYDLYTGFSERQHDVGYFNHTWGHANYIEYWYNNGLKLPDFDVRMIWQYYHPPFHHWLMALLLKLLNICGMEYMKACEALQILLLLYSQLCFTTA